MVYGFLAREGMRKSEAAALQWSDLDLERGTVRLDTNKTNDPRLWALDPGVVRALRAWQRLCGEPGSDELVFSAFDGAAVNWSKLATRLREQLETGGVHRGELFENSATRQRLRAHDLRATFVTLSLACGKSEAWISDRTGHRSSSQIQNYRRAARTAAELNLGPLAPLDLALPELRPIEDARKTGSASGEPGEGEKAREKAEKIKSA